MGERKIGVEEELMLIDPSSGQTMAVSHRALQAHRDSIAGERNDAGAKRSEGELDQELFLQQIETASAPCLSVDDLRAELARCRRQAAESATAAGAAVVAVGAAVLAQAPQRVTPKPRYQLIVDEFGEIGRQASVCGMHVHVDVSDDDEAVHVLDGLRPWLPVLRALSVNSPFWLGEDTGYASWRSQVWGRWPASGPCETYGNIDGYRVATDGLIASGAALDRGMLYLDARLAESYPTVEIRVFDASTELDDVCLIAALTRSLVDTIASADVAQLPTWRSDLLRAAHWRAARHGLANRLLDPTTQRPARSRDVVQHLISYVRPALDSYGETESVLAAFERLVARGTGSSRQRAVAESAGGVDAVLRDLRDRFTDSCSTA